MDVDAPQLVYPNIAGYRVGEMIGGGGFSKWVDPSPGLPILS